MSKLSDFLDSGLGTFNLDTLGGFMLLALPADFSAQYRAAVQLFGIHSRPSEEGAHFATYGQGLDIQREIWLISATSYQLWLSRYWLLLSSELTPADLWDGDPAGETVAPMLKGIVWGNVTRYSTPNYSHQFEVSCVPYSLRKNPYLCIVKWNTREICRFNGETRLEAIRGAFDTLQATAYRLPFASFRMEDILTGQI